MKCCAHFFFFYLSRFAFIFHILRIYLGVRNPFILAQIFDIHYNNLHLLLS